MIELLKDNLIKPVAVLPYLLVLSLLCCGIINFALGVTSEEQSKNVEVYGCGQLYDIHCDVLPNSFESVAVSGIIHQVYEVRTDPVAFSNGPHGKALVIPNYQEGPDQDYIPKNTLLNPPKFSVSFWIKPYPAYRFIGQVLSHVNSVNTAGWFFITEINQTGSNRDELLKFIVTNDNGSIFSPPEVKIKPNNFIHIVGTFDGNFVKLYADGVLYGSERYEGKYDPDPRTSTAIGVNSFNYKKTWSGYMDDLRIYNRVLDSDDVKEIFDNSTSANVDGLVGHWPFNGNLDDVSGNENNAVVTGPVVSMAFTPDGRLFFSERTTGKVRIMENDTVLEKPFVTIPVMLVQNKVYWV